MSVPHEVSAYVSVNYYLAHPIFPRRYSKLAAARKELASPLYVLLLLMPGSTDGPHRSIPLHTTAPLRGQPETLEPHALALDVCCAHCGRYVCASFFDAVADAHCSF